ncbi:uncharacterized protein EI90DRAFT_3014897 [Cantharellus anzutake]|uniref:uncharacterized protein n=1 Tax=Cantharellus anzutake TaxID=1750568 RepID=UPI001904D721|nr:uncharacterized protein EI90DRAFT_3014897 [Cantharellus anzutake]KAF8334632.1 hypothetical protein EI90DRAFT_3014897 [Cantharellus anzutake]
MTLWREYQGSARTELGTHLVANSNEGFRRKNIRISLVVTVTDMRTCAGKTPDHDCMLKQWEGRVLTYRQPKPRHLLDWNKNDRFVPAVRSVLEYPRRNPELKWIDRMRWVSTEFFLMAKETRPEGKVGEEQIPFSLLCIAFTQSGTTAQLGNNSENEEGGLPGHSSLAARVPQAQPLKSQHIRYSPQAIIDHMGPAEDNSQVCPRL